MKYGPQCLTRDGVGSKPRESTPERGTVYGAPPSRSTLAPLLERPSLIPLELIKGHLIPPPGSSQSLQLYIYRQIAGSDTRDAPMHPYHKYGAHLDEKAISSKVHPPSCFQGSQSPSSASSPQSPKRIVSTIRVAYAATLRIDKTTTALPLVRNFFLPKPSVPTSLKNCRLPS
jgi:hypothetical protein